MRRGMFGAKGTGDTSGYGRLVRPVALPGSSPRPYGGYFDDVVDSWPPRSARTATPRRSSGWWSSATS